MSDSLMNDIRLTRAETRDSIPSRLPQHIVEQYPNFVEFLESYYAWLGEKDNPYHHIKHHMDYVTFEKSLDDYIEVMMGEFLTSMPKSVTGMTKEMLIEWSRRLNLARGSRDSFNFLFKILFGEQEVEVYLPKDNILRTSDGRWVANQYSMIVTNPGNADILQYRKIGQKVEIFPGTFREAEAVVESIQVSYSGRFNIVILTLVDVVGDFVHGEPITVEGHDDVVMWPVKTVVDFIIENGGSNFFKNEHIIFEGFDQRYIYSGVILEEGKFDTRVTTILTNAEVIVEVDGVRIHNFTYDGQYVMGPEINLGKTLTFIIPQVYVGTMKIGNLSQSGGVLSLTIEDPPIGIMPDIIPVSYDIVEDRFFEQDLVDEEYGEETTTMLRLSAVTNQHVDVYKHSSFSVRNYDAENPPRKTTSTGLGSGLIAYAVAGVIRKIPGYYADTRGWLSSNMYLQDNNYYQEYSYEIRATLEFNRYASIVKELLHPSGFKMFGHVRIYSFIEAIIKTIGQDTRLWFDYLLLMTLGKYTAGSNYNWVKKAGAQNTRYVYPDMDVIDSDYVEGDPVYDLEDDTLNRTFAENGLPLAIMKKGWMAKNALSDFDTWVDQDYVGYGQYGGPHVESLYVGAGSFVEDVDFINNNIDVYITSDYVQPEYS